MIDANFKQQNDETNEKLITQEEFLATKSKGNIIASRFGPISNTPKNKKIVGKQEVELWIKKLVKDYSEENKSIGALWHAYKASELDGKLQDSLLELGEEFELTKKQHGDILEPKFTFKQWQELFDICNNKDLKLTSDTLKVLNQHILGNGADFHISNAKFNKKEAGEFVSKKIAEFKEILTANIGQKVNQELVEKLESELGGRALKGLEAFIKKFEAMPSKNDIELLVERLKKDLESKVQNISGAQQSMLSAVWLRVAENKKVEKEVIALLNRYAETKRPIHPFLFQNATHIKFANPNFQQIESYVLSNDLKDRAFGNILISQALKCGNSKLIQEIIKEQPQFLERFNLDEKNDLAKAQDKKDRGDNKKIYSVLRKEMKSLSTGNTIERINSIREKINRDNNNAKVYDIKEVKKNGPFISLSERLQTALVGNRFKKESV